MRAIAGAWPARARGQGEARWRREGLREGEARGFARARRKVLRGGGRRRGRRGEGGREGSGARAGASGGASGGMGGAISRRNDRAQAQAPAGRSTGSPGPSGRRSGKAAEDVHELQLPQVWGPSSVDEDPLAASETRLPRLQDLEALRRRKSFKWFNKCVGRWRVASTPPDIGVGSHS